MPSSSDLPINVMVVGPVGPGVMAEERAGTGPEAKSEAGDKNNTACVVGREWCCR